MDLSFLSSRIIGVMGLGKTGLATASFFRTHGYNVVVWDDDEVKRNAAIDQGYKVTDFRDVPFSPTDKVIWSPGIAHYGPNAHPFAEWLRSQKIEFISDMDIFCSAMPQHDVIAITGTNGKSTTTALMNHTLRKFRTCEMGGNIGAPVLTLPELPKDGAYIFEFSSYQLELTPHLTPVAAVLLNITPDHLARHGDMQGYINAKMKIFDNVRDDGAPRIAVIGQDTLETRDITNSIRKQNKWTIIPISVHQKYEDGVWVNEDGDLIDRNTKIANLYDHPVLKGEHNFENMAAVYAVIRYMYGYESASIWNAMKDFGGLPHRQFLTRTLGHVQFINDSKATNADATEKALKSYSRIYLIAGGQPKEGGLKGLERYFDRIVHTVLIGDAMDEFGLYLDQYNAPYTKSKTLDQAVNDLWAMASKDSKPSVILLSPACASWDQFRSFEHRGQMFEDFVAKLKPISNMQEAI